MRHFAHNIGDYAAATAHLSFIEDAAYHRCLRRYYQDEEALPADVAEVCRLVGARTRDESEGELVKEGREVWLGYNRVGNGVVQQLLSLCAIKDVSDEGKRVSRYVINSTGEALVANPLLESALVQALWSGKAFTIIDGKIQDMSP